MAFVELRRQDFLHTWLIPVGSNSLNRSHVYLCVSVFLCFFPRINVWHERPACILYRVEMELKEEAHIHVIFSLEIYWGAYGNPAEICVGGKCATQSHFHPCLMTKELCWESVRTYTFKVLDWGMSKSSSYAGTSTVLGLRPWKKNLPGNLKIGCPIPEWLSSESKKERPVRSRECGPLNFTNSRVHSYPLAWGVRLSSAHSSLGSDPGWYPLGSRGKAVLEGLVGEGELYLPGNR